MNYYIDTEFLEGSQRERFPISLFRKETKPTIDLISIGIVTEDGREYYAISKDFNLDEAWNRFDLKDDYDVNGDLVRNIKKVYWIRENVLNTIFMDLQNLERGYLGKQRRITGYAPCIDAEFCFSNFKRLLKKFGKTNKQIAEEIKEFCTRIISDKENSKDNLLVKIDKPIFYGYYADYDWVVFCWLFGKMIDLPNGFPKYCNDLKQMLEEKAESMTTMEITDVVFGKGQMTHNVYYILDSGILKSTKSKCLMNAKDYSTPSLKQTNEHNALADARWNKNLHEFLMKL